jgi:DNA-binding MarR family transcriptional regulator
MSNSQRAPQAGATSEHSVGRRIAALGRMARSYVDSRLAPFGIGFSQAQILVVLYKGDGISQHDICGRLHIDKSAMTRTIRRLVDEGYVQRLPDPADERAYRVVLTAHGRAEEEAIMSVLRGWTAGATDGLSADEVSVLHDTLARMSDNAERMLESD